MSSERTPKLFLMGDTAPARAFALERVPFTIGRDPACDVVLKDEHVSKRHAAIFRQHGQYLIKDGDLQSGKASHNGTYVNGTKIDGATQLEPGDQIVVHKFQFVFQTPIVRVGDDDTAPTVLGSLELSSLSSDRIANRARSDDLLPVLLGFTTDIASTLDTAELLDRTLESIFKLFPKAERGFVLLKPPETEFGEVCPQAYRFRGNSPRQWRLSRSVYDRVLLKGEAILSKDIQEDGRFRDAGSLTGEDVRTLICVPLLSSTHTPIGILQVDTSEANTPFSERDLDLLAGLAGPVSLALENALLHKRIVEFVELDAELKLARGVQKALLPSSRPRLAAYDFWDIYEPAKTVGGDYFDYLPVPRGPGEGPADVPLCAITIADVSGKGLPAALFMARLSTEVRFQFLIERDPVKVVENLNHRLDDGRSIDHIVTFLLLLLDPATHQLVRRAKTGVVEPIATDDCHPPLCAVTNYHYSTLQTTLEPGDLVLLTTDGIEEAFSPKGDVFSAPRIVSVLSDAPPSPAGAGIAVLQAVRLHVAGASQSDDIAIVCLQRRPQST
jgi:serine phosphatase RsbU (regulator of sigma subunit)/pSer/pThr/pTyr-binding forkhead associated (FHA) protein